MNEIQYPQYPVLLVDDEEQFLLSASFVLTYSGINHVLDCSDSRKVMSLLSQTRVSVILLDIIMPYIQGTELLESIQLDYPDIPVIMLTALNEVELAVKCMKAGAFDYLVKPVDDTRLVTTLKRAIEYQEMKTQNTLLKKYLFSDKLEHPEAFGEIITQSSKMRTIFQYAEAIGPTLLPVLITGETGVGKELIARAIHNLSGCNGEFVPVNIAGVDDNLFSDTLFGHKKGAFTGALRDRKGLIEQAAGGTIFLDEIGDLAPESQVKLLRLLQEGKYYPLGADLPKTSNARVIVATNADLMLLQKSGKFRKDLYYRLQAHHLHIPPLNDRKEDIPLLLDHFLEKAAKKLGKKKPSPPKELLTLLRNYNYPGNIRELEGMIFDAVGQHKSGILSTVTFREKILSSQSLQKIPEMGVSQTELFHEDQLAFPEQLPGLKEVEQKLIEEALRRADGNQRLAAQMLGLSRRALNNRLQRGGFLFTK